MKIIKNLLATVGLLIVLIVAGFAYLGSNAIDATTEHSPFVEQFMQDFSQNWHTQDIKTRLSDSFIDELDSKNGRHLIQTLQSYGQYESLSNLIVSQYNSNTHGKSVNLTFTAHFSNGPAAMSIHLIEVDDTLLVNGLYITSVNSQDPSVIEHQV